MLHYIALHCTTLRYITLRYMCVCVCLHVYVRVCVCVCAVGGKSYPRNLRFNSVDRQSKAGQALQNGGIVLVQPCFRKLLPNVLQACVFFQTKGETCQLLHRSIAEPSFARNCFAFTMQDMSWIGFFCVFSFAFPRLRACHVP